MMKSVKKLSAMRVVLTFPVNKPITVIRTKKPVIVNRIHGYGNLLCTEKITNKKYRQSTIKNRIG